MRPEAIYKDIGGIIRALRRGKDRAQDKLALQLGISRATLANIETGRQRILVHQLYAIAKSLDVKLTDLLPPPREEHPAANRPDLRFEGDELSAEQKDQVASFVGTIGKNTTEKAEGTNAKGNTRLTRREGRKAAR